VSSSLASRRTCHYQWPVLIVSAKIRLQAQETIAGRKIESTSNSIAWRMLPSTGPAKSGPFRMDQPSVTSRTAAASLQLLQQLVAAAPKAARSTVALNAAIELSSLARPITR
jgi:hypothetical protein